MRFSLWPSLQQPWADVLELAARAERTGWDGLWFADHFMGDGGGFGPTTTPNLEATAVIAAVPDVQAPLVVLHTSMVYWELTTSL